MKNLKAITIKKDFYTNETECVMDAQLIYDETHECQLIFKKKRKYIIVQGSVFSQTEIGSSPIRQNYENNCWEFRGWVDDRGCFKNN